MKKFIPIWLGVSLLLLSLSSFAQEVKISLDHPDQVRAGEVFEVSLTIQKGDLTDYSRFSQDLPLGLNATNVSSPNADFSFDNQRIRIIWLKLPEDQEIKVKYNVQVDEKLKGNFSLGGVFAYVISDERRFLNVEDSREITIIPSSTLDPELIVDIREFKGGSATAAAAAGKETKKQWAMAVRQKPVLQGNGSYLVKLLVQNPKGSKYAKIEESIPSGYLFESVDPHSGIESFSSSTVKFIWMKLPQEAEFEVSYSLAPKRDESQDEMNIRGQLTYSAGNVNKVVEIKEVDAAFDAMSLADKRALLISGTIPQSAVQEAEAPVVKTEPVKEVKKPVDKTPVAAVPAAASGKSIMNTPLLANGTGVYYRVQLTANLKAYDARDFFRGSGLEQKICVEQHEGMYKYTAGSFTNYRQALDYRDEVERLEGVVGAFVVAYKNGRRVPVTSVR